MTIPAQINNVSIDALQFYICIHKTIYIKRYINLEFSNLGFAQLNSNMKMIPSQYYSLMNAITIPEGADLNDYTEIGNYICHNTNITKTLKNCPQTSSGFTMTVERVTGNYTIFFKQRMVPCHGNSSEHWRTCSNGSFSGWYHIMGTPE